MIHPLANISASAKHTTDTAMIGSALAGWLIDHTSLFTAVAAFLTIFWIGLRALESLQSLYFGWKYGPDVKRRGDD